MLTRLLPATRVFALSSLRFSNIGEVDVILVNGVIPAGFPFDKLACGVLCWDTKLSLSSLSSEWHFEHLVVSHANLGGVSNHVNTITIGVHDALKTSFQFDPSTLMGSYPAADVGALLDCRVYGTPLDKPPRLQKLVSPSVTSVGNGVFHYRGLFPVGHNSPCFYVPCVFSKSGWVKRELTHREFLQVFDLPINFVQKLSTLELSRVSDAVSFPGKSLHAVVNGLFGPCSLPGGEFSSHSQLKPSSISEMDTTAGTHLPVNWIKNTVHNRDERAAKNDDAEVPLELWHEALASALQLEVLSPEHKRALAFIRSWWCLYVWRRSVTRCFCKWIACPQCRELEFYRKFHQTYLYSNKPCDNLKQCDAYKRFRFKSTVIWLNGAYYWSANGKAIYKKWYRIYHRKKYSRDAKDYFKSLEAGIDCIERAFKAKEWTWPAGSRTFFWRWGIFWKDARDGSKVWVKGDLPKCMKAQSVPKDAKTKSQVKEKISDVRNKGYITKGYVKSLTSFFDVPKGDGDIRMVYNGTSSGLNDAVWAPWFNLPTVETHLRAVVPGTFMCDIDLSEMFLNFMLDEEIRPYAGVDFTKLFEEENLGLNLWERWIRLLMGFKPSPYLSTRDMKRIDQFLTGNRKDLFNIFRWSKVVFNLPGSLKFDPSMPSVYKSRDDGTIAADLFTYIDDLRNTAPSKTECWNGAHQVCCRLTWLGLQDAPRKRSNASQLPRAWAGTILHSDSNLVSVLVSESKWSKTKTWIEWLKDHIDDELGYNHKMLEKCRGFLIYVSRTYTAMKPYLKGLHKTIDRWRPARDEEGWKIVEEWLKIKEGIEVDLEDVALEPTEFVLPVKRMKNDVQWLSKLTSDEAPPKVTRRTTKFGTAYYGFGDASGKGFGHAVEINGMTYKSYGQWSPCVEDKHSNYKEFKNLTIAIKNLAYDNKLNQCFLIIFTDNFVAECAYYKGGSNASKELDSLVFELWELQMKFDFSLFIYHVAGTRMIEAGIDGLSRGDKSTGIASGVSVHKFIPIHEFPFDRSPELKNWIQSWWNEEVLGELTFLKPEEWYYDIIKDGNFVWNVPPAAGDAAVEKLCDHNHANPSSSHIFVIPRLCTAHWRKQLIKVCDVVLTFEACHSFWPTNMHEPIILGIVLPILPHDNRFKPWRHKTTKWLASIEEQLRPVRKQFPPCNLAWHGKCYKKHESDEFPVAKLNVGDLDDGCDDPNEVLRYTHARNGDHFMVPFQCDLCHFRNLQGRNPQLHVRQDKELLVAIRRASLDSFWSRETTTINKNRGALRRLNSISNDNLGLDQALPPLGPHPVKDAWGVGLAVAMLRKSLDPGNYSDNVQFETVRILRAAYSNLWGASIYTPTKGVLAKDTMKTFVTDCPSYSLWFERFVKGMHSRMGDDRRPDAAFSVPIMKEIMKRVNYDYEEAVSNTRQRFLARSGMFFLSTFIGGLRGEEVPRVVTKYFLELNTEARSHRVPHSVYPLYGRFKGEQGVPRCFLLRLADITKSGFNFRIWVDRVLEHEKDNKNMYLFSTASGRKESPGLVYEPYLHSILAAIQRETVGLIPNLINVEEVYGISRSGRRGGTTNAENAPNTECDADDIKRNNRWRTEDRAGTKQASLDMLRLYTDTLHSVEADLRFSMCQ